MSAAKQDPRGGGEQDEREEGGQDVPEGGTQDVSGSGLRNAAKRILDDLDEFAAGNSLRELVLTQGSRLFPDFHFRAIRTQLLRWAGCDIARGSSFLGEIVLSGPKGAIGRLRIGTGSIIAPGVKFDLEAEITLGQNVAIGPHCILATSTHALGTGSRRMRTRIVARPIVIEDGVWVGIGSMVLAGVRIGHGAVISAGSVVTQSVAPNTLVAGNPAHVVKTLPLGDR